MEEKSDKLHKENCKCKICNNGIKEERQYAALEILEGQRVILDVEEYEHFDRWIMNRGKDNSQPMYEEIMPEDNSVLKLVYGVLIPQYNTDFLEFEEEVKKFKGFALATLESEKIYLSAYQDIKLFPDMVEYDNHIPCAMVIDSPIDFSRKKEYGFGHTMYIKCVNLKVFDNIFNRKFLFCMRDLEDAYIPSEENWKKCINTDTLQKTAKELL